MRKYLSSNSKAAAVLLVCLLAATLSACGGAPKKAPANDLICKNEASIIFYFQYGSSALDLETKESAKQLAQKMACYKGKVRLEGHTDSKSSSDFNKKLGLKRAAAVKDFIISLGIDPSRIEVITYGKENPLVKGSGPVADAKNRCVVVVFEGLTAKQ